MGLLEVDGDWGVCVLRVDLGWGVGLHCMNDDFFFFFFFLFFFFIFFFSHGDGKNVLGLAAFYDCTYGV